MQADDHQSVRLSVHCHFVAAHHCLAQKDGDHLKERHQAGPGLLALMGAAPDCLMPDDTGHPAPPDCPMPDDRNHLESVGGSEPLLLMAGLTDHKMMPDDMERPHFQTGAPPPGWLAEPDENQPPDHSGPPGGQTTHYALAWLAYSPLNAAEVIGRLCSVGAAYPNSR